MDENSIKMFLKNGGIITGYYLSMSGNYMIMNSKEIVDNKMVITQTTHEMGGVEKIVSVYPVEVRDEIPKELLTE